MSRFGVLHTSLLRRVQSKGRCEPAQLSEPSALQCLPAKPASRVIPAPPPGSTAMRQFLLILLKTTTKAFAVTFVPGSRVPASLKHSGPPQCACRLPRGAGLGGWGQSGAQQPYSRSFASQSGPWPAGRCSGGSAGKRGRLAPSPVPAWEGRLPRGGTHGLGGSSWGSYKPRLKPPWQGRAGAAASFWACAKSALPPRGYTC